MTPPPQATLSPGERAGDPKEGEGWRFKIGRRAGERFGQNVAYIKKPIFPADFTWRLAYAMLG